MNNVLVEIGVMNVIIIALAWLTALFSFHSMRPEVRRLLLQDASRPAKLFLCGLIGLADGIFRWAPRLPDLDERRCPCADCNPGREQPQPDYEAPVDEPECPHESVEVYTDEHLQGWCMKCDAEVQRDKPPPFQTVEQAQEWLDGKGGWRRGVSFDPARILIGPPGVRGPDAVSPPPLPTDHEHLWQVDAVISVCMTCGETCRHEHVIEQMGDPEGQCLTCPFRQLSF